MTENQKKLKKLMIDADLENVSDLARMVGVTPQFMGQLLRAERKSKRVKARVARILGISGGELTMLIGP